MPSIKQSQSVDRSKLEPVAPPDSGATPPPPESRFGVDRFFRCALPSAISGLDGNIRQFYGTAGVLPQQRTMPIAETTLPAKGASGAAGPAGASGRPGRDGETNLHRVDIPLDVDLTGGPQAVGIVPLGRTLSLLALQFPSAARVRLYSTTDARDADLARDTSQLLVVPDGLISDINLTTTFPSGFPWKWIMKPIAPGADMRAFAAGSLAYTVDSYSTTGTAGDFGTGADGPIDFDGVTAVPHCTLAAGVYSMTADINATSIRGRAGVTVKTCNWFPKCNGDVLLDAGFVMHNDGSNGVNGGNASGSNVGGAAGTAVGNTTNPSSAGSLLISAPGSASGGGAGQIWGSSPISPDSTSPTDGHTTSPGATSGGGGGSTCGTSLGGERGSTVPTYQGGAGGGNGARKTFAQAGCGGGGASAGSDGGPVKLSGRTITIGGTVRAHGGQPANGGNASSADPGGPTFGGGGGGGGGGGSRGGRPGQVTLITKNPPTITGTVGSIGYDTVVGAGGGHGNSDGSGCSSDGFDASSGGGGSYALPYALVLGAMRLVFTVLREEL